MPLIQVRVIKDVFSKEQKRQIISIDRRDGLGRRRERARRHLVRGRGGGKRRLGKRRQRLDHRRRARLGARQGCLIAPRCARTAYVVRAHCFGDTPLLVHNTNRAARRAAMNDPESARLVGSLGARR
jgi:hypothetical protein